MIDQPDRNTWLTIQKAQLYVAALLSLDIEPASIRPYEGAHSPMMTRSLQVAAGKFLNLDRLLDREEAFHKRLLAARSTFGNGGLDASVPLPAFAKWAIACGWSVPDWFQELADQANMPTSSWPWGEHTTKLLEALRAAAGKFWKLYDSADPSTAPTNEQVKEWLITNYPGVVGTRVAEVMAQILRADNLPRGPRTRK